MNSTHFHEIYIAPRAFFIVANLMGLSMQTLKNNTGQSFHGETMFIMLNSALKHV